MAKNWKDNEYFSLNVNAKKAMNEYAELYKQINSLTKKGESPSAKLFEQYSNASENLKKYNTELSKVVKTINKVYKSTGGFTGLNPKVLLSHLQFSKINSDRLLRLDDPTVSEGQRVTAAISKQQVSLTEQHKSLQNQTKLEMAQLALQAAQAFTSGFTQAMAAAESKFRMMASDAVAKNDWIGVKNSFQEALEANKSGNIVEGAVNTIAGGIGGGMAGSAGGPIGMAVGAVVGVLGSLAGSLYKFNEEVDQINYELDRTKKAIIESAFTVPDSFKNYIEAKANEKLLNEPEFYRDELVKKQRHYSNLYVDQKFAAQLESEKIESYKKKKAEYELYNSLTFEQKREYILNHTDDKDLIASAYHSKTMPILPTADAEVFVGHARAYFGDDKNSPIPKPLSDEDIQELTKAEKAYKTYIANAESYDKLQKTYQSALDNLNNKDAIEKDKQLLENNLIKTNQTILEDNRALRNENNVRSAYGTFLSKVSRLEPEDALKEIGRFNQTDISNSLKSQENRIAKLDSQISYIEYLRNKGSASSEDLSKLISLENNRSSALQQLQSDKSLYSQISLQNAVKAKNAKEVVDIYRSANSSKYLTDNMGSFSRYFGKTDPMINISKETNEILKNILKGINDLTIPEYSAVWQ